MTFSGEAMEEQTAEAKTRDIGFISQDREQRMAFRDDIKMTAAEVVKDIRKERKSI